MNLDFTISHVAGDGKQFSYDDNNFRLGQDAAAVYSQVWMRRSSASVRPGGREEHGGIRDISKAHGAPGYIG